MQIATSKTLPSAQELVKVLKQEFSNQYSYKLFGLGKKSIIIGKSTLVGAQISIRENEITIQATAPSLVGGILSAFGSTELAVFLLPVFFRKGLLLPSQRSEFEKEIGLFFKHKYN
jgi:hypothetical protein